MVHFRLHAGVLFFIVVVLFPLLCSGIRSIPSREGNSGAVEVLNGYRFAEAPEYRNGRDCPVLTSNGRLVDFKSTTRKGYTSASFKSKGRNKEERTKKKFGGGASKATIADKGKSKFMSAQGKSRDAAAETRLVDQDLAKIDALRKGKSRTTDNLMYVNIGINGKDVNPMLDSGATHTFVADRLVKELGLRLSDSQTSIEVELDMLDRLCQASREDVACKKMVELVREGTIRRYWLEQDLLYAKRGRIFMSKGELRKYLMMGTHDP
uniref:Uncharacterized protein n=1 Tax=Populus alba TaxID=43335 RepID=A0A4U5Q9Y5_POPAL|nr:hypothetical protein D5086_0000117420 [Populus alba]